MPAARGFTAREFRILLIVTLVILTIQGWSGDTVNIFFVPSTPTTPSSFFDGVESAGALLVLHASEGILLSILAVAVFVLSFVWSKSRVVRISSGLGLLFVILVAVGGFEFVVSGFSDSAGSAQMATGFLGSYAMYFVALYYSRSLTESGGSLKASDRIASEIRSGNLN
jgi:hypothetical protein